MPFTPAAQAALMTPSLLLQLDILQMLSHQTVVGFGVMTILVLFSLFSWAIVFSKYSVLKKARESNTRFLRAFRKASGLDSVVVASEQFRPSPLVAVFDFGYEEVHRQVKSGGSLRNKLALERALQLGISEELAKLERNLNWLATTATVTPFIGLFGTVIGIMVAFSELAREGATSLRAVAPGISEALLATAFGLAAAIPAAIFYNHFGHVIKEIGARMDDFSLEFLNLTERDFEG